MKQNTLSSLQASHQRLVRLMQEIGFGRIENLHIQGGLPVFDPPPRIVMDVKFGGDNGPRPQISKPDFVIKQSVTELISHMRRLGDGVIDSLLIRGGTPFSMSVEMASHSNGRMP